MKKVLPVLALGPIMAISLQAAENKDFNYHVDRFADIEVLRYEVPGFNELSLNQKKMLYYLSQVAGWPRHNLGPELSLQSPAPTSSRTDIYRIQWRPQFGRLESLRPVHEAGMVRQRHTSSLFQR